GGRAGRSQIGKTGDDSARYRGGADGDAAATRGIEHGGGEYRVDAGARDPARSRVRRGTGPAGPAARRAEDLAGPAEDVDVAPVVAADSGVGQRARAPLGRC